MLGICSIELAKETPSYAASQLFKVWRLSILSSDILISGWNIFKVSEREVVVILALRMRKGDGNREMKFRHSQLLS